MTTEQPQPKRIKIRRLGKAVGELVCLLPTIDYVRRRFPDAFLTFQGDRETLELIEGLPQLDDIQALRDTAGGRRIAQVQRRRAALGTPVREEDYDLVIDLQSAVHDYMEGVEHNAEKERIDIYLDAAARQIAAYASRDSKETCCPPSIDVDRCPSLPLHDGDRCAALEWMRTHGITRKPIGIQLRSPDWQKNVPMAFWREVAKGLRAAGHTVVTFDPHLRPHYVKACYGQPLRKVAALIEQCAVLIGPDSGLMHIAGAVGTPTVWLAGKTNVEALTKHYEGVTIIRHAEVAAEIGCRMPCYGMAHRAYVCGNYSPVQCMAAVTPDEVVKAALEAVGGMEAAALAEPVMPAPEIRVSSLERDPVASVIVPVLNEFEFTRQCLDSLRVCRDVPFDVIVVNNGVKEQRLRKLLSDRRDITLIRNLCNAGYGAANNQAAEIARGEYLVFLNNDTRVTDRFIGRMLETFKRHSLCAAVGNKHLSWDGKSIYSAGSYCVDGQATFRHRFFLQPKDTHEAGREAELNMATGACLMVRKDVFDSLTPKGFDATRYPVCYCEDTDLCLRIRQAGWRIFYCPGSVIYHFGSASRTPCNPVARPPNRVQLEAQWFASGEFEKIRLHNEPHVVAGLPVLNEAEYLAPCIESAYDFCTQIILVEGGNDVARKAGLCAPDGHSQDCTHTEIQRLMRECDPARKIRHIRGYWPTKTEQRAEYLQWVAEGQWLFVLDADDIYYPWQLARLRAEMMRGDVETIAYRRRTFWARFDTWVDGRWDDYNPWSLIKWRRGMAMRPGTCSVGLDGRALHHVLPNRFLPERLCNHYAYVRPMGKIEQKLAYYAAKGNQVADGYMDTFRAYQAGECTDVSETHPFGGFSPTHPFDGPHPAPVQRRIDSGEFGWGVGRGRREEVAACRA